MQSLEIYAHVITLNTRSFTYWCNSVRYLALQWKHVDLFCSELQQTGRKLKKDVVFPTMTKSRFVTKRFWRTNLWSNLRTLIETGLSYRNLSFVIVQQISHSSSPTHTHTHTYTHTHRYSHSYILINSNCFALKANLTGWTRDQKSYFVCDVGNITFYTNLSNHILRFQRFYLTCYWWNNISTLNDFHLIGYFADTLWNLCRI